MTDTQPEALAAFLAGAEYHIRYAGEIPEGASESLRSTAGFYAPRLFAAVQKALAQHRPGRLVILGALCSRHENHRHFSITSTEAADVTACPDCPATVYDSCAGCGPHVSLDSCPVRTALTRELLGEGEDPGA